MVIDEFKNDIVQQFINQAVRLYQYTSSKNMVGNNDYDAKHSIKLGKNIDKIVQKIINSKSDFERFIKLIDSKDLLIAYLSAEYIYPIYPQKCIKVMKMFYNSLEDKIDQFTLRTKIEGLSNQESFFMNNYKKLYNCEDVKSLNRENCL